VIDDGLTREKLPNTAGGRIDVNTLVPPVRPPSNGAKLGLIILLAIAPSVQNPVEQQLLVLPVQV
jgi:hypothetical protein